MPHLSDTEDAARCRANDGWTPMADDGFVGLVGPFYERRGPGQLRFRFPTGEKHRNRRGVVQGGALMTFADRTLGSAARGGVETDRTATIHMDYHFVDVVHLGEVVEAAPTIVRATGRLVFMRAELQVNGRTVGLANGVWKRVAAPADAENPQNKPETNIQTP